MPPSSPRPVTDRPLARLLLAATLLAAPLLLAGCRTARGYAPVLRSTEMALDAVGDDGIEVKVEIQVDNPLPVPIVDPLVSFDLSLAGAPLASESGLPSKTLRADGWGTVTLPLLVVWEDVDRAAVKDIETGEESVSLGVTGEVAMSALGQAFHMPYGHRASVPVVRPFLMHVVARDFSALTPTGGSIRLVVDLSNPNPFDIGLSDTTFACVVGDGYRVPLSPDDRPTVSAGRIQRVFLSASVSNPGLVGLFLDEGVGSQATVTLGGTLRTPHGKIRVR